jgi:NAD-dependent deacetylase
MDTETLTTAARMLLDAQRIVVFTGAGISTESGIPDFRSPGGIWSRYNQDDLTFQKFRSHEKYRKIYWEYDRARYPAMRDAIPNAAHEAITEMEQSGRLLALITQNIDGLHRKAGNSPKRILELHGTVMEVTCLDCHTRWPREEITDRMDREGVQTPYCPHCGGPLKCATIAFGQSLPADVLENALACARDCDLFLTIGSSLVVQPACFLPLEAKRGGARLILVNLEATPYDQYMDIVLAGKAAQVMDRLMGGYRSLK